MLSMDTKHALEVRRSSELPRVDERLIAPDSGYEIYEGELAAVSPAHPAHARQHSKLAALVEAHASVDFFVACDMLTRTSETSDVAPDVSVCPRAPDPVTGGRQLEHLVFEILSTERLSRSTRKAGMLADRGVRRVFAIDIENDRALEWSRASRDWDELDPKDNLEDPVLAAPLPIAELLSSAAADDAIARALITKGNREIEALRANDRKEGLQEGRDLGLQEGRDLGLQEGRNQGLQEGRNLGLQEGRNQGLQEGRDQGLQEGRNQGLQEGRNLGLQEGRDQGLQEGRNLGLQEGWNEGVLRGKIGTLLSLLADRGIAVSSLDCQRILAETNHTRLDRWTACAVRCTDIAELFAMP